jgi:serine/threonine protein kinase
MSSQRALQLGEVIGGYEVKGLIGHGSYADVYMVVDPESRLEFALKLEKRANRRKGLDLEQAVLEDVQGSPFFPKFYASGVLDDLRYIVMEALGPSVSDVLDEMPSARFSLSTALRVGIQMLRCIQEFHKRGYIVRDVKPDNFLIRDSLSNPIVLIDFGLARLHIDRTTGYPIPARDKSVFVGTIKYASPAAHRLEDLGRRDDVVSWWYAFVDIVKGDLPWPNSNDREKVYQRKIRDGVAERMVSGLPDELRRVWPIISQYGYADEPDYELLMSFLMEAMNSKKLRFDEPFDWQKEGVSLEPSDWASLADEEEEKCCCSPS